MTSEELTAFLGRSPFVGFLGVRFALSGDELTVSLPYREGLIGNPMVPALHGGALAAMLEIAAIAQLFIQRELTDFPKPVDVSVDYLRVGRPVDTFARAHVARGGAR
ncbi:MAG: PaaI family thioesterase, partial [Caulobacterales bacterium]|nr:PaaI family thioesterase [Caulobacterales bacterium]